MTDPLPTDQEVSAAERRDLPPELVAQLSKPKSSDRPMMPCPHCGKTWWREVQNAATAAVSIECAGCLSRGPAGDSRSNAMELWNWRAPQENT